jgi:hypothetical protein
MLHKKGPAAADLELLLPPLLSVEVGVLREYHPPHRLLSMYF